MSCDNAFVTNILLPKQLIGRPQEASALRESEASATNVLTVRKRSVSYKCFNCAKAKRQLQSAQSERKSTSRFAKDTYYNTTTYVAITLK